MATLDPLYRRQYVAMNRERVMALNLAGLSRIKEEGLTRFGRRCGCCGETGTPFLTLDHIAGRSPNDGRRRQTGKHAWAAAKREGWPTEKYQILCFNCNCAKGIFGVCPHQMDLDALRGLQPVLRVPRRPYPARTHCRRGHELTPENSSGPKRSCRICLNAGQRTRRQAKRETEQAR